MELRVQAVVRGPSFTGFGKRPDLTPAHQLLRPTGISAGIGGVALGSPMICFNLRKPASGSVPAPRIFLCSLSCVSTCDESAPLRPAAIAMTEPPLVDCATANAVRSVQADPAGCGCELQPIVSLMIQGVASRFSCSTAIELHSVKDLTVVNRLLVEISECLYQTILNMLCLWVAQRRCQCRI